jgi:hypothetical protein
MTHAFPAPLPTLATLGFRWSGLQTERAPFGTVAWLEVSPAATISTAATTPGVSFHETGVVARLRVRNETLRPVVVPSDLVVDGGKQARVIESSIVLPPEAGVDVPVRCVEHGRWHAKSARAPHDFEIRGATSSRTRSTFARNKSESLTATGRYELDQHTVWGHVHEELQRTQVVSTTHSYADFIEGEKASAVREARAMAYRAPDGANGFLVTHASGNVWCEVLPTREDLRAIAEYVLADLFDPASVRGAPRSTDAPSELLDRAWRATLSRVDVPAHTLGTAFALRADEAFGSALVFEGRLAHLGITNAASA